MKSRRGINEETRKESCQDLPTPPPSLVRRAAAAAKSSVIGATMFLEVTANSRAGRERRHRATSLTLHHQSDPRELPSPDSRRGRDERPRSAFRAPPAPAHGESPSSSQPSKHNTTFNPSRALARATCLALQDRRCVREIMPRDLHAEVGRKRRFRGRAKFGQSQRQWRRNETIREPSGRARSSTRKSCIAPIREQGLATFPARCPPARFAVGKPGRAWWSARQAAEDPRRDLRAPSRLSATPASPTGRSRASRFKMLGGFRGFTASASF